MMIKVSCNNRKGRLSKKNVIIIPKKNIKKANKRNKIRRQIKSILCSNKKILKYPIYVKYFDNNIKPEFLLLKQQLLAKMQTLFK